MPSYHRSVTNASDPTRSVETGESRDANSARDGDGKRTSEHPRTVVRGDEPSARCPYCGRPFREERLETLHRGLEHPDRLSDRERAAFERAYREEEAELRRFRLLALGAVIICYFSFLFVYAVVT